MHAASKAFGSKKHVGNERKKGRRREIIYEYPTEQPTLKTSIEKTKKKRQREEPSEKNLLFVVLHYVIQKKEKND